MKVLFIIHQIGAGSDGGLVSIGELLKKSNLHQPVVVTNIESDFTKDCRAVAEIDVLSMHEDGYGKNPLAWSRMISRVRNNYFVFRKVKKTNSVIVHINDHRALWNGIFGARLAGAKVIFNVRDSIREGASILKWKFYLYLSDCFLTLSREMEDHWQSLLAPISPEAKKKFRSIYSIVDTGRFYPVPHQDKMMIRKQLGIETPGPVLIYVGRFDEKKAQLDFIQRALPLLYSHQPEVRIYFVGDYSPESNPYSQACWNAVESLGMKNNVCMVGYTIDIADWYKAADLNLLASTREGLARCMIEGLACGLPMVSFSVCSAREILEGYQCGRVVDPGDYTGFAKEVLDLLKNQDKRIAMAEQAVAVTKQLFSSETNVTSYKALLREYI